MAEDLKPIIITFGGGINTRRRQFDIDPQECVDGQNFDLNQQLFALKRRNAIQLLGTAPNGQSVRGYAQRVDTNGSITTLIQAGGDIYQWDGGSTFTAVGTCNPGSRLRSDQHSISVLDGIVIITDLDKLTPVQEWNGTSLSQFSNNLSSTLYAKFCRIQNERAYFGNVQSGTDTPHVILGSKLSDIRTLTVSDRPSSALADDDPFFLVSPNLKPINGMEHGFGQLFFSTQNGELHVLSGISAHDFSLDQFYEGSSISGVEAMVNIGNDILLGMAGRIETLSGTINFGDVETDDVSLKIQPDVKDVTDWRLAYDRTLQKVFCFPNNRDEIWVLHKSLMQSELSPWAKWVTDHPVTFQPSCVIPIIDPDSGLESVFIGGSDGAIYKLDGRTGQDGGTTDITLSRTSIIYRIPEGQIFDVMGAVTYQSGFEATVTITFLGSGVEVFEQPLTFTIPAASGQAVYNGSAYYSGNFYYNAGRIGQLRRRKFPAAGNANFFQVRVDVTGASDVVIEEVELNFRAASEH